MQTCEVCNLPSVKLPFSATEFGAEYLSLSLCKYFKLFLNFLHLYGLILTKKNKVYIVLHNVLSSLIGRKNWNSQNFKH